MARFKVLLVDDSETDRLLARIAFSENLPDVDVHFVGRDYHEFERCLNRGCFHLVITDYDLGWSDGFEVIRRVRQRFPACQVMVYSGMKSSVIRERALAEQVPFLDKTADLRNITMVAGHMLSSRPAGLTGGGCEGSYPDASAAEQTIEPEIRMPWNSGRQPS